MREREEKKPNISHHKWHCCDSQTESDVSINLVERTPTLDLSLLIGQPKLSLEHLFHVFLWLLIGYLTSFIVFFCELIWFRCHTHSKIISCEIRDRKVSRVEACRKISASKTTGEWLRIIRSSYKRK